MRIIFLSLFLALTTAAQKDGFSVDEQGRAWFVTDLTPRDSDIKQLLRLWALNASSLRMEAETVWDPQSPSAIVLPAASSDGNTLSWSERYFTPCSANRPCPDAYVGVVVRRTPFFDARIPYAGSVSISRNGLWALWINPSGSNFGSRWVNLSTGEDFPFPGLVVYGESVASDGSVATAVAYAVEVRTPTGSVDRIPTTFDPIRALISANTRHLLVTSAETLFHYDRDLSEWTTVAEECGDCRLRAISTDGTLAVSARMSVPWKIHLTDLRARTERTIAITHDQVTGLQFSDDGSTLWVMTSGLELLRLDTATGEKAVIMPPSPVLTRSPHDIAPGSRFRIDGDGLAAATLSLNGRTLETMDRGRDWLQLMIPTDLPPGPAQWSLESPGALFHAPLASVEIVPQQPQFLQLRDLGESDPEWVWRYVVFAASDGGLINPNRPAIPGEELLFWMTGLNGDTGALSLTLRSYPGDGPEQAISMGGVEPDPIRPGWWIARLRLPAGTPPGYTNIFCRTADLPGQLAYAEFPVVRSPGNSSNESSK